LKSTFKSASFDTHIPYIVKKNFWPLFSSMYCMTPTRYDLRAWGRLTKTIFKNFPDIYTHLGTNLHYIPIVITKSARACPLVFLTLDLEYQIPNLGYRILSKNRAVKLNLSFIFWISANTNLFQSDLPAANWHMLIKFVVSEIKTYI
jgi:hypothetical protein